MMRFAYMSLLLGISLTFTACGSGSQSGSDSDANKADTTKTESHSLKPGVDIDDRLDQYEKVKLTANLDHLSSNQKAIIKKLIKASQLMDEVFWHEAYGSKDSLLAKIQDPKIKQYVKINYGPWDRLKGNEPFLEGFGPKPEGANYYPENMTKEEFKNADLDHKASLYTLIRKNEQGELTTQWYHEVFEEQHQKAADLLEEAAKLASNDGLKKYLNLRAEALRKDEYKKSNMAWLDMKANLIDVVIGPIEVYEDRLFNYKAAHEGFVLLKDQEWSQRLNKYADFLPRLQENLPVPKAYKQEEPGRDADLNAYQALYYGGDANAGPKTIAINLPNNEEVQLKKGTRRLQLKNAMRAKFDKILQPISEELIAKEQRKHISFQGFFGATMFHEVAHGLGIKNTINDQGKVSKALKEHHSAIEEGKADILGLYMITKLHEWGELDTPLKAYYTTFMASIFRSVRFGASSAHGKANMIRFNYFKEQGAFVRQDNGTYQVNYDQLQEAMTSLTEEILTMQGDGDYEAANEMIQKQANIGDTLQKDLESLDEAGIPVDIIFEQGIDVLGLQDA